jgi:DNA ligase-1
MEFLQVLQLPDYCHKLIPISIYNEEDLLTYESKCISEGYEGVMLRTPDGPYKCGRSTAKEAYLLKLKRFEDSEATIVGYEERMHNNNELDFDAFGYAKRSSHKANLVPANTLGALKVKDIKSGKEFNIGTGFDDAMRKMIWDGQDSYLGKIVVYKHQPSGSDELPRFPVFKGFRNSIDM